MATLTHSSLIERRLAFFKRFDLWLIGSALMLLGLGLLSLYSVDAAHPKQNFFNKQIMHVVEGLVPFAIFLIVDPRVWRRYANWFYGVNIALLALVLKIGRQSGGGQRWLQIGSIQFQPSRACQAVGGLTLAAFFLARADKIRSPSTFGLSLLHVAIPMFLVFKQPHLGATLVILVSWLAVSIAAGVPLRYLIVTLVVVAGALTFAFKVPGVLPPYMLNRVQGLISPQSEGNAYQTLQAQIAFGSGGLFGDGWMKGKQKEARLIPEQDNDFIFTVVGEEGGLVACAFVLALYGLFFYRIWLHMIQTEDPYFRMITAGIFAVLAFHTVVNLG